MFYKNNISYLSDVLHYLIYTSGEEIIYAKESNENCSTSQNTE